MQGAAFWGERKNKRRSRRTSESSEPSLLWMSSFAVQAPAVLKWQTLKKEQGSSCTTKQQSNEDGWNTQKRPPLCIYVSVVSVEHIFIYIQTLHSAFCSHKDLSTFKLPAWCWCAKAWVVFPLVFTCVWLFFVIRITSLLSCVSACVRLSPGVSL